MAKKKVRDLLQAIKDREEQEKKELQSRVVTERSDAAINRRMRVVTREHRRKAILSEIAASQIILTD